ncbi:MAG: ACP S-malonyltransferase [Proteobacteria bacterium]|nr:ACP S-malonyltransferase [Pseudomonadota bacterium]
MKNNIFLFPGQGSQEIGMGRDLFSGDDYFISLVDMASHMSGEDLRKLCLKGPEKQLRRARFLQPLIVAVSLCYMRHLLGKGIRPEMVIGHSLGEITAIAAAGVISDTMAITMSAKRGELMDEAASACDGSMMAVMQVDPDRVNDKIIDLGFEDKAFIANYNSPEQIVISGDRAAIKILSDKVSEDGAKCRKLNVYGPWHSPYLKGAREKFSEWVKDAEFKEPEIPIVFNATGGTETDPQKIKALITVQLTGPVYFRQCLQYCGEGKTFFEVGPGRVLSGLVRANGFMKGTLIYNVNDLRGVETAASETSRKA